MLSGKWRPFCLSLNVLNITATPLKVEEQIGFLRIVTDAYA